MLPEEIKCEIEAEMGHYPRKQAACIEAMKIVQRRRGWVSDESIQEIAELLEMTPDELDSIATFYNLIFRRPVGRHVILICDSVSCWIMGCEQMIQRLRERLGIGLGETTANGDFTLLPIACLGTCDHAPALMIDSQLHRNVTPGAIDQLLDRYRGVSS